MQKLKRNQGSALIVALGLGLAIGLSAIAVSAQLNMAGDVALQSKANMISYYSAESGLKLAARYLSRGNTPLTSNVDSLFAGITRNDGVNTINGLRPVVQIIRQSGNYNIFSNASQNGIQQNLSLLGGRLTGGVGVPQYTFTMVDSTGNSQWDRKRINGDYYVATTVVLNGSLAEGATNASQRIQVNGTLYSSDTATNNDFDPPYNVGFKLTGAITYDFAGQTKTEWIRARFPNYQPRSPRQSTSSTLTPSSPSVSDTTFVLDRAFPGAYARYMLSFNENNGGTIRIFATTNKCIWLKDTLISRLTRSANNGPPIIRSNKEVYILGTVKGKVTVVSTGPITPIGHVIYSDTNPATSTDKLTLVSGSSMQIYPSMSVGFQSYDSAYVRYNRYVGSPMPFFDWQGTPARMRLHASVYLANGAIDPQGGASTWNNKLYQLDVMGTVFSKTMTGVANTGSWGINSGFTSMINNDPRVDSLLPNSSLADVEAGNNQTMMNLSFTTGNWSSTITRP